MRYCFALSAGDDAFAVETAQATYLRIFHHVPPLPDETALHPGGIVGDVFIDGKACGGFDNLLQGKANPDDHHQNHGGAPR